jgi:hypothetical protein
MTRTRLQLLLGALCLSLGATLAAATLNAISRASTNTIANVIAAIACTALIAIANIRSRPSTSRLVKLIDT